MGLFLLTAGIIYNALCCYNNIVVAAPETVQQIRLSSLFGSPKNIAKKMQLPKEIHNQAITAPHASHSARYCAWETSLDDCKQLFSESLGNKRKWFFMGDSNMWLVYKVLRNRKVKEDQWQVQKIDYNRCNRTFYFGYELPEENVRPNFSLGEGPMHPTSLGMGPYCSDLSWAFNMRMGGDEQSFAEFLVVEFARDVEAPSLTTGTTQETVAKYLQTNYSSSVSDTVCVANTGLHDMMIPGITKGIFIHNMRDYMGKLSESCGSVVWVTLGATLNLKKYPQRMWRIRAWNDAVLVLLELEFPNIFILDVFPKSLHTKHVDNTHFVTKYYKELAKLFLGLLPAHSSSFERE
jgi:hypothetical protein